MLLIGGTKGYVRHALSGGMCFTEIQDIDFNGCISVLQYDNTKIVMSSTSLPFQMWKIKNFSKTSLLILKWFSDS